MSWLERLELFQTYIVGGLTLGLAAFSATHAILYKRRSQAALAWVGLILLVPLVGALLYGAFGINRIRRKAARLRPERPEVGVEDGSGVSTRALEGLAEAVGRITSVGLTRGNQVEMLRHGGQAYPAMLRAIEAAERTVTMSTYIFDKDREGEAFIEALAAAHARGVEVRVMLDAVGSKYSIGRSGWTALFALKRRGVRAAAFMPLSRVWRMTVLNLRTHRKVLVVDGRIGFTGGINVREHHVMEPASRHPTHDTHFRLEGPVVRHLQRANVEDWHFVTGELLSGEAYWPEVLEERGEVLARGIKDGPDEDYEHLQWVMLAALSAARERVVVVTPYFVPDEVMQTALQTAALSGVRVDIVLPERSNLRFVDWASAGMWGPLLERGCHIWRVGGVFDHSKLMVVDGHWTLLGSGNWDARSLKLNFEFNVECYDEVLAAQVLRLAQDKMEAGREVTLQEYEARGWWRRLRDGVARLGEPYL